jgi:hypothetical protein
LNETALDYYLLPALDFRDPRPRLHEENGTYLDALKDGKDIHPNVDPRLRED